MRALGSRTWSIIIGKIKEKRIIRFLAVALTSIRVRETHVLPSD
jgi:hypothetical protein